jgi:hypothetical protein
MFKFSSILTLFIGLVFFSSCNIKSTDKALMYYDNIVTSKTNPLINTYEDELIQSFKNYVPSEMKSKYEALEDYVLKLEKEFADIDPYFGDATLIDGAKKLVAAYKDVLPIYKDKVAIESLTDDAYGDGEANESSHLSDKIDAILNPVNEEYIKITEKFAADNNFTLK